MPVTLTDAVNPILPSCGVCVSKDTGTAENVHLPIEVPVVGRMMLQAVVERALIAVINALPAAAVTRLPSRLTSPPSIQPATNWR